MSCHSSKSTRPGVDHPTSSASPTNSATTGPSSRHSNTANKAASATPSLSRAPFLSVQQRDLLPPAMYDGTEPSEPRTVLLAQIDSPHGQIAIGSTHLPRSSVDLRDDATTQLLKILQRVDVPWIVCGDFNQTPAWLDDQALDLAPKQPTPTYPASDPSNRSTTRSPGTFRSRE